MLAAMRAIVCKELGPPSRLVYDEVPTPRPGPGQVLIAVRAAGVNFPDSLIIEGKCQFRPEPPFSPGSEVAGVIEEVGEGVSGWSAGDRVIAILPWGGYAERVVAPQETLLSLPEGIGFDVAATFINAYGTSYYALRDRARLAQGETLLVLGAAGGVGLAAVDLGKLLGARVIAAAGSAEKLAVCMDEGAELVIDYSKEDLKQRVRELTGGAGVDVVYDPVGGSYSEAALRGMAWGGRYLVIGFAAGDIPKVPLNLALLKGCSIVGVFWGSFLMRTPDAARSLHEELLGLLAEKKLRPRISARYPLAEAARALDDLSARRAVGKVVLEVG